MRINAIGRRQPARDPKPRKPDVVPEERDDLDSDPPDLSLPDPYQLPGVVQPPAVRQVR